MWCASHARRRSLRKLMPMHPTCPVGSLSWHWNCVTAEAEEVQVCTRQWRARGYATASGLPGCAPRSRQDGSFVRHAVHFCACATPPSGARVLTPVGRGAARLAGRRPLPPARGTGCQRHGPARDQGVYPCRGHDSKGSSIKNKTLRSWHSRAWGGLPGSRLRIMATQAQAQNRLRPHL